VGRVWVTCFIQCGSASVASAVAATFATTATQTLTGRQTGRRTSRRTAAAAAETIQPHSVHAGLAESDSSAVLEKLQRVALHLEVLRAALLRVASAALPERVCAI
jgi:hypothetical protein